MTTPIVTETPLRPEPVVPDTFIAEATDQTHATRIYRVYDIAGMQRWLKLR